MPKPKKPTVTPDESKRIAEVVMQPEQQMAQVLHQHLSGAGEQVEMRHWVETLRRNQRQVVGGDLSHLEEMLVAQAEAMSALFMVLATTAQQQSGLAQIRELYGLAFRAQAGSRATIQAVMDLKYPRQSTTFIRQGNVAAQQIVANGDVSSRARETVISPNELSGDTDELRQDTRASAPAGRVDPPMETVGEVHRTTDGGR